MRTSSQKVSPARQHDLRIAGIYLFGVQTALRDDFCAGLTLESVKSAFRRQARLYHPDVQGTLSPGESVRRQEWFLKIRDAYDTLREFCQSARIAPAPVRRRIIAVGGAQGGVGKSVFAANLGVYLAARGFGTVLVDLAPGGASLHLYLGETTAPRPIDDFFRHGGTHLAGLACPTRFGPSLVGGDSSRLGSASISAADRRQLIAAVQSLEADRVILDLGGGASPQLLDFLGAAHSRIIVTTAEPAAYLEAYNLIKAGLFHRLQRLITEPPPGLRQDQALTDLILWATSSNNGGQALTVFQLLERLALHHPRSLPCVKGVLSAYRPKLLVNMNADEAQAGRIVRRIQEVAQKMLAIRVDCLGTLPYLEEISRSAREFIPAVVRHPQGLLNRRLARLVPGI
jgi:flagellar biosynthesis protein FlhG